MKFLGNNNLSVDFEQTSPYNLMKLIGKKWKDKFPEKIEDNIYNNREFGEFFLDIPLHPEDYKIKNEPPKITEKKGIISIEFELEDKKNTGVIETTEEDEV